MKKVVIIPDSFKGTMTSKEICDIIGRTVKKYYPDCNIVSVPVADGGEGSVDCFLTAVGGKKVYVDVKGPYFENIRAYYGIIDQDTAVIEMASCAGLPLVEGRENPMKTTTYGVGQMILHAASNGCKKIILGLGGSCTNDGGTGAAAALGVKFFNDKNEEFVPVGGTLKDIAKIDISGKANILDGVSITAMCDIDNVMYGSSGAAFVFAPQKGADEKMVKELDNGLMHLSDVIESDLGVHVSNVPGAGAAGAMGAGMLAFCNAELKMGIQVVLDTVNFDKLIEDADVIFTGEGKIDGQSLRGKVVVGVARRAKKQGIPVVAIVGDIGDDIDGIYDMGVNSIFSINRVALPFEQARKRSKSDLESTVDSLLRFSKLNIGQD